MLAKNLKHLRTALKQLTQSELADHLAISRSTYVAYELGRIIPPADMLIRLSKYYTITIDVMLKVDITKIAMDKLMKLDNNRILLPLIVDPEGNDSYIEVVSGKASAGYLQGYADAEYIENLERFSLPFLPTGKHRAFQIEGDSMLPVKSGSYIIGKYVEHLDHISDSRTYVVLTKNDGCTYKRLHRNFKTKKITLSPDNDAYKPYEIPFTDILELWEFTCTINTQEHRPDEINLNSVMNMLRALKVELKAVKI